MLGFLSAVLPSLIGGALSNKGQSDANETNVALAKDTRDFNAAEAQKNRDFQAEQSASAYQRATSDMQKAGLNPMLAYSQGGAGTPGGSTASAQQARVESTTAQAGQMISNTALTRAQLENLQAQTAATAAQAAKTVEETKNIHPEGLRIEADTRLKKGQFGLNEQQQRHIETQVEELVQRMKRYPLDRDKLRHEVEQIAASTKLTTQKEKTELQDTLLRGLSVQHSRLGLDESKASSAFFKEGAVGEQSRNLRLLLDIVKGMSASGFGRQR